MQISKKTINNKSWLKDRVMNDLNQKKEAFAELLEIIATLREKCPWDKKQTMESLRSLSIEEVYELGDAVLDKDMAEVKKELGDLIMHIVFYAQLGQEAGVFDMADVLTGICEKLKYRHPHIYGDVQVENAEEVLQNWEQLKLKEKGRKHRVLEGVPRSLPALVKAYRMQDKVRGVGFDWKKRRMCGKGERGDWRAGGGDEAGKYGRNGRGVRGFYVCSNQCRPVVWHQS